MAWETWVQSQVKSYQRLKKWYLMPLCLTLSIIKYGSKVKRVNPGKGVAPSLTFRCSSYRKGRPRVTLDNSHQVYLFYFYIHRLNKEFGSKFYVGSRVQYEKPEGEGRDNSPNILSNKTYQASTQKFKQIIFLFCLSLSLLFCFF